MIMSNDNGLTVKETAERLGVSERTVRRWIKVGKMHAELIDGPYGQQYVIPLDNVQTIEQTVAVATVEKTADPLTIALAISQAMEARDNALKEQIEDLQKQLSETAIIVERIQYEEELRNRELKEWLDKRLPKVEAKRLGLIARVKRMLLGDHSSNE